MANARIVNTPSQAITQDGAAHTQRTIAGSAVSVVNWTLNANSTHVMVQFNGGQCRVTFDGTTPTATKGFLYADGGTGYWTVGMASKAKAIAVSATVTAEVQELNFL